MTSLLLVSSIIFSLNRLNKSSGITVWVIEGTDSEARLTSLTSEGFKYRRFTTGNINDIQGASSLTDLERLNSLKSSLNIQLNQIELANLSQTEKEEEAQRIKDQISLVNSAIDHLISVTENPAQPNSSLGDSGNNNQNERLIFPGNEPGQVTNEENTYTNALRWISYFLLTVLGILFKALWESPSINSIFAFRNFKPVLIAPIVFYGVYATINTLPDSLLAGLIAFQNGFFWQSILRSEETRLKGIGGEPTSG